MNTPQIIIIMALCLFTGWWIGYKLGWKMRGEQDAIDAETAAGLPRHDKRGREITYLDEFLR